MSSSQIKYLPKEALFNLLLQVEPREIKIVCGSLNRKVREICQSDLFKEAYKKKYPKKLLGKIIDAYKDSVKTIYYDEKGNSIEINHTSDFIIYTPYKQIYPSTYIKNYTEDELRKINPITIFKYTDGKVYIGRDSMTEVITNEDEELFLNSYNKEVKEFLEYIEREKWWNPNINFDDNQVNNEIKYEFLNEVTDLIDLYYDGVALEPTKSK